MRNVMFVFVLLFVPSTLTAMPTIALFLNDNESEVHIRPREAIALPAHETCWWFGKSDLVQAVCQYTMPPYSPVCGEPDVCAKGAIPLDAGDFCSLGNAPAITLRQYLYEMVVLGLESERQLGTGLLWTETIAYAGRDTPCRRLGAASSPADDRHSPRPAACVDPSLPKTPIPTIFRAGEQTPPGAESSPVNRAICPQGLR